MPMPHSTILRRSLACLIAAAAFGGTATGVQYAWGENCTAPGWAPPSCTTPAAAPQRNVPQRPCPEPCETICCQPCGPSRPRGANRGAEQTPSAARGAYVAPPPSGIVQGPRGGTDLGTMSITFPELTIGLPRLRLHGRSQFQRQGHMELDSSRAAFVEYPVVAQQTVEQPPTRARNASPPDQDTPPDNTPRGGKRTGEPHSCTSQAPEDGMDARIKRLERCVALQCEALDKCMEQLKANGERGHGVPPDQNNGPPPIPHPDRAEELPTPIRRQSMRMLPPTDPPIPVPEVDRATYLRPVDAVQVNITQRLPPVE